MKSFLVDLLENLWSQFIGRNFKPFILSKKTDLVLRKYYGTRVLMFVRSPLGLGSSVV